MLYFYARPESSPVHSGIGVLGLIFLFEGKWRSFEGMVKIRKLADDGVTLLEELRQRIKSISSIADPNERVEAQWIAVADYLDTF